MKKKLVTLLLSVAATLCLTFGLTACGETERTPEHTHSYDAWIRDNETTHTRECSCGDSQTQNHTFNGDTCSVCGYVRSTGGNTNPSTHNHAYGAWICDGETTHTRECSCGDSQTQNHTFNGNICSRCNYVKPTGGNGNTDPSTHSHNYTQKNTSSTYLKTAATCTEPAVYYYSCSCGKKGTETFTSGSANGHSYSNTWSTDANYHWHASTCGHTSEVKDKATHTFNSDEVCTVCQLNRNISIKVSVYIDGQVSQIIYASSVNDYKITAPEKPEDITTNPNSERYFYGWFVDANYQTPLTSEHRFTKEGRIYGRWIDVYSNNFTYTVSQGKATITDFRNTTATVVVVPAYLNSFPVSTISDAFKGKTQIRTAILCEGITQVGDEAFSGCNSMESITLPNSLQTIGSSAFFGCSLLTSITIPNGVTSIGSAAFENCRGITSLIVGNSVTSIGNYAFENCSGLTSLTIPNNVTSIGSYAFRNCSGLTSVTVGNSVTSIGSSVFQNCSGLTSVTIPNNVKNIEYQAFSGCSELTSIYYTGDIAGWCGISGLEYLMSYGRTLYIGDNRVTGDIVIPDGVTSIRGYAFSGCSGITNITIPDSVTSIGEGAFGACSALESITLPFVGRFKDAADVTNQYPFGYIFGKNNYMGSGIQTQQFIYGSNTNVIYYIPSSLKSVVITGGSIFRGAFRNCIGLTSITIPDNVTSIAGSAFYFCSGLASITIPSNITNIGDDAFLNCYKLIEIYNRSSLNIVAGSSNYGSVAYYAKNVYTPTSGRSKLSTTAEGYIFYDGGKGERYLMGYTGQKTELTLPTNINNSNYEIYQYAFYKWSFITNVAIGSGVTSIGDRAFLHCSGLTSITIPNSIILEIC